MEVLVFRTNIKNKKHVDRVSQVMYNLKDILRWNVDLLDRDKILRIETQHVSPRLIEVSLQKAGYDCSELED